MIVVSHRGNLNGPNPVRENSLSYIQEAINFHPNLVVEIDVWQNSIIEPLYLGHDFPQHRVELFGQLYPLRHRLICHAKTVCALNTLLSAGMHVFFHTSDEVTLTSLNWLWTMPNGRIQPSSIWVLPEQAVDISDKDVLSKIRINCRGVCTDYPYIFLKP